MIISLNTEFFLLVVIQCSYHFLYSLEFQFVISL